MNILKSFQAVSGAFLGSFFLATLAHAVDLEGIDGFREYKFGRSFEDVNNSVVLLDGRKAKDGTHTYDVKGGIEVGGRPYRFSLTFFEGKLSVVGLTQAEPEVFKAHCALLYDELSGKVSAVYGEWNTPETNINLLGQIIRANKRIFPDTTTIVVNQVFLTEPNAYAGKCSVSVRYLKPQQSDSF